MADVDRFIQVVVEKKNELLGPSGLNETELTYFLAGVNAAVFALSEVKKESKS